MSDFYQDGTISTLHDFGTKSTKDLEKELLKFSKERKMELILPCLYSELEGSALPNIVEEISKTKYLDHIIIGLDKANETQAKKAWKFFKKLKSPFSILWNDGPSLKKLDHELKKNNLAPSELGKGRNVWYCIGMSIARDTARSVALHDCDIPCLVFNDQFKQDQINIDNLIVSNKPSPEGWADVIKTALVKLDY